MKALIETENESEYNDFNIIEIFYDKFFIKILRILENTSLEEKEINHKKLVFEFVIYSTKYFK